MKKICYSLRSHAHNANKLKKGIIGKEEKKKRIKIDY